MLLTLATAACLSAIYGLYVRVVGSQLQSEAPGEGSEYFSKISVSGTPRENVTKAQEYLLLRAPWATTAQYQLRTEQTFVYAEHCEPLEADGVVQLKPFAMIWFQDGDRHEREPITMVADSAVIQFASKFDVSNIDLTQQIPDRIVGGKLNRDVIIAGPDGLLIQGRNFIFEESAMHIRSDNAVQFAHGPHRGSAHGVQIELTEVKNSNGDSPLVVSGIDSIRLFRNVEMKMALGEPDKQGCAEIHCAGSFEYVLQTNIATFEDDVRVLWLTGPADSLQCQILKLFFKRNIHSDTVTGEKAAFVNDLSSNSQTDLNNRVTIAKVNTNKSSLGGPGNNLTFSQLKAEGRTVVLNSSSNSLTAHMTELEYDAVKKVAVLRGGNRVHMRYGTSDLHCPEITLLHGENGKIVSAWCRGAGWLTHRDLETQDVILSAQWLKQLRKYPDPNSGLDIIELKGQAIIRQPNPTQGIKAEFVKIWIDDQKRNVHDGSIVERTAQSERIRPRHLLALQDVVVVSPELQGRTNHLRVWFDGQSAPHSESTVSQGRKLRTHLRPALRHISKSEISEPQTPVEKKPVILNADSIQVRVLNAHDRDDAQLAEVWTEGDVHVWHEYKMGQGTFDVTGDRLQLQNVGELTEVLRVSGNPARVRDGAVDIEGPEIFMERNNNLTWIEGPGQLQLPVKTDLEGKVLQQPSNLKVSWQERMQFDGQAGDFFGNVYADLKDTLTDHRMQCQQMRIELTNRIDFSQQNFVKSEVEIRDIVCKEGVVFFSHEYAANGQIGIRRARLWKFSINTTTGRTEAYGPGEVTFWQRGRGKRAALSPTAVAQANQPLRFESQDWEYTRIVFSGQTTGNLKQRHTKFHDQVQIVYGPVKHPFDCIDSDTLPKDAVVMRCDILHFAQQPETPTSPSHIELRADGNARLEGRKFYARADMINYDESKGLYSLRSIGTREATIWRQKTLGGKYSRANAQSMKFIPSRNFLEFDQTTRLQDVQ